MGIVDKIEAFVNETKEMSLKKVMDKIEDGYWEAEEDVKVGKHVTIRDTKTKKRMTILVTEDLDEGFKVKTGLQGALSINGKSIAKTEKQGNNVFIMIDKEDGDKARISVPNGKNMMASEIAEWLEDYLKKNPKALTESSYEKDLDESSASLIVSAVKKDIGLTEKKFKIAHLTGNIESPKNNDKCVIVFKANGKPKFKVYTFDSSNKWVPGEVFTDSNKLKSLWKDFPNVDYNLNEAFQEEDSLDFILEAAKMPLTLKIGDSFKTDEGSIKITDITVSSLHMNPITYITYKYDVVIDGKSLKGEEKASVDSFKDHFKK